MITQYDSMVMAAAALLLPPPASGAQVEPQALPAEHEGARQPGTESPLATDALFEQQTRHEA